MNSLGQEEFELKRSFLLDACRRNGLDAILLSRPANIAWYTCGGRAYVVPSVEPGIADLLVSPAGDQLYTDEIEAERLQHEELRHARPSIQTRPWWQDRTPTLPRGPHIGSDCRLPGYADAVELVRSLRQKLTPAEIERYRSLGRDAACAVTAAALTLEPVWSEFDAAGRLAQTLLERGMEPILLLVAGADRLPLYRHPLPTAAQLGRRAMLVAVASRGGLFASLTRLVSFAQVTSDEQDRYRRLLAVEAAFLAATTAGKRLGEIFTRGVAAYTDNDFDAAEWHRHHQGGPTGYFGRDEFVTPTSLSIAVCPQAFAWNPSVSGLKVEDTVVTGNTGVDVLTRDTTWPSVEVSGRERPAILER